VLHPTRGRADCWPGIRGGKERTARPALPPAGPAFRGAEFQHWPEGKHGRCAPRPASQRSGPHDETAWPGPTKARLLVGGKVRQLAPALAAHVWLFLPQNARTAGGSAGSPARCASSRHADTDGDDPKRVPRGMRGRPDRWRSRVRLRIASRDGPMADTSNERQQGQTANTRDDQDQTEPHSPPGASGAAPDGGGMGGRRNGRAELESTTARRSGPQAHLKRGLGLRGGDKGQNLRQVQLKLTFVLARTPGSLVAASI
jgi:hypothetical protein